MINIQTEQDLLLLRESEEVEFKAAVGKNRRGELPAKFWHSYSAMANANGGYIFLGVEEEEGQFRPAGLSTTEHLRKQIADAVNSRQKTSINLFTNDSFHDFYVGGCVVLCVQVPRAKREQRPVYLNGNPLNSYRRLHETNQQMTEEEVKRYLAEQLDESRDSKVLSKFDFRCISGETLRIYRQIYSNQKPTHPWNELDDQTFLTQIGGARRDRETDVFSLTVAGLLMFGTHPVIQEVFPNYMLDYQEYPTTETQTRWGDRVTLDGSWSGNLFDFQRRIYPRLVADLKIPFQLNGDIRIDESPVHVALREALVNTLVHADYSDRASVLVVKRPDGFGFRNPGLMRVSWETAMKGGESDCRNRILHQMFRYVGLGEQAGSGIPKILDGWRKTHWKPPSLYEKNEPYDQTVMTFWMIDIFPAGTVEVLQRVFHGKGGKVDYKRLDHPSQVALALAYSEGMVSHERLKQLTNKHSADLSQTLSQLVESHILRKTGKSRGAVYHLIGLPPPLKSDDVFGSGPNSTHLEPNSTHLEPNSTHKRKKVIKRDRDGCILHRRLNFPILDKVDKISDDLRVHLDRLCKEVRESKRIRKQEIENAIKALCTKRYITISSFSTLLGRSEKTLRNSYLSRMVKEKKLQLAFPAKPNDPRQAYIAVESLR